MRRRSSHVCKDWLGLVGTVGLLVSWCGTAAAQQQAPAAPGQPAQMNMADHRGGIRGVVRNESGAPVAGAAVTAVSAENGAKFESTTDEQGNYSFGALPVGNYEVTISSAGNMSFRRTGVGIEMDRTGTLDITLNAASAAAAAEFERQQLLERIASLEQRINDLESETVLSEPETRVRRVEVFVDENGNEHDQQVPNSKEEVTYRRERVYRRQTISEKIDAALEDADKRRVTVGVDAAMGTQYARRTAGDLEANRTAYALASADLFFTAGIAQYTIFFADIVGLSGSPPDTEIPSLTLLNGYTARLVTQNQLNLREAWLRTELFGQKLALTAGRLDLTNYFDQNAFANDESTQFLSDALVNNQMLGLSANGTGVATEFDPKNGFRLKFGFQQSNDDAPNLSDSMFTLTEVGYTFTPFALPEGTYRAWFRTDNTPADPNTGGVATGFGLSIDQKVSPFVGVFARYGTSNLEPGRDNFWSVGLGFQNAYIFNPQDTWGVGYAQMDLEDGRKERLTEGYYNFHLTERLRLSFHLTHVLDNADTTSEFGYLLPGVRFQAAF
jgi:Carboxypeptidase regulatory-like domain